MQAQTILWAEDGHLVEGDFGSVVSLCRIPRTHYNEEKPHMLWPPSRISDTGAVPSCGQYKAGNGSQKVPTVVALFPQVFLSFSHCFLDIDSVHSNKQGKHLHQCDKSSKAFVLHPCVHTASLSSESQMGTPNRVRWSRKKNHQWNGQY